VVLLLGLAAVSVRTGRLSDSILPVKLPTIQLGLVGLEGGNVNVNALAAAVLLIAPIGVAVLVFRPDKKSDRVVLLPIGVFVVIISIGTLAVCQSRSASVVIWLIPIGLLMKGIKTGSRRLAAGVIVLAPLAVAMGIVPFLSRGEFQNEADNLWKSAHYRVEVMAQGLGLWRESPWFGVGLNEFRSLYLAQGQDIAHSHNIVLQTALDVGLVGSAAYWSVLAFLWLRASEASRGVSRLSRSASVGSGLSLVAVTLFGISDAVPLGSKVGMLQWIASGLILAAWRTRAGPILNSHTAIVKGLAVSTLRESEQGGALFSDHALPRR